MISEKIKDEVFEKIFQQPENKECFECQAASYKWASVNNGILLCLNCSGVHRGLGVNVSYVRSVDMDSWSEKQLNMMLQGGNAKLKAYFDSYNMPKDSPLNFKFKTKAGIYYREMLKCIVEGNPVPEPPNQEEALQLVDFSNPDFQMNTQQGFGNNQQQQQEEQKQQNQDDPVEYMKTFFTTALTKTKEVSQVAYQKTSLAAQEAKQKIETKYNDPEFQQNVSSVKTKVVTNASEFGGKASEVAQKGYLGFKTGLTSAWGFMKQKTEELQHQVQGNNPQQQQQQQQQQEDKQENNMQ